MQRWMPHGFHKNFALRAVTLLFAGTVVVSPAANLVGAQSGTPAPTVAATQSADQFDLNLAVSLSRIEGYVRSSYALVKAGRFDVAAADLYSMSEEYAKTNSTLKAQSAHTALKAALDAFTAAAGQSGDAKTLTDTYNAALDAIGKTTQGVLGPQIADSQFEGNLITALLHEVESDYDDAYQDGNIATPDKFRAAMGLLTVASAKWDAITQGVESPTPQGFTDVSNDFKTLAGMFPDFVLMPSKPAAPTDVEKALDATTSALSLALQLNPQDGKIPTGNDNQSIIAAVRQTLAQALADYKAGKHDDAYEESASAYLDHFEDLEPPLLKKDQGLVATMEGQFKALRDGIKAGDSQADVEAIAKAINDNLDKVAQLLQS
ncbi:MAG TPA: hypothetical protein VKQ72_16740 [Aggregatilineales bacterium]|nr:hypothetical protein [Aggregatilineales bacterium]